MNGAFYAPLLTAPPVFADEQPRRESLKMASRPFQFFRECVHKFGMFCPEVRRRTEGRRLSYTPCLLTKPALRLWLHATQSQPCFPAASNPIALLGGNRIFAATPTERITHYTLQAKPCAKGRPLWEPLTTKQAEYPALSRCLILSLYLLSAARFSVCLLCPCP